MTVFQELLLTEFSPFGALTPMQLQQLEGHYELLLRWNRQLNLTRISDVAEAVRFHYCESLFLGGRLPKGPFVVADVGSGGGFPGIPVAVLRPDLEVVLIESHQRKAVFLREAARDLLNVRVENMRAEDWAGKPDWVISRAVTPTEVLSLQGQIRFALLVASADAPVGAEVERLPWGKERVLAFHVEHKALVPRETKD